MSIFIKIEVECRNKDVSGESFIIQKMDNRLLVIIQIAIVYQNKLMGPYLAQPITQKHVLKGESRKTNIKFSLCEMQGWRRYMQDAAICQSDLGDGNALFAVFDGHGGPEVAKLVQKILPTHLKSSFFYKSGSYIQALTETFKKVDQIVGSSAGQQQLKIIRKKSQNINTIGQKVSLATGCTANVILITPKKIIVANAGDTRSCLCRAGKSVALSIDHKPQNQQQYSRIKKAGGQITNGRINGGLNVSRTLGDFNYKQSKDKKYDEQLVICKPDVRQFNRTQNDQFIIIGCDGIWQRYVQNSQPLVTTIHNEIKTRRDSVQILKGLLDSLLAKETNQQVGCDNMTAILIQFL